MPTEPRPLIRDIGVVSDQRWNKRDDPNTPIIATKVNPGKPEAKLGSGASVDTVVFDVSFARSVAEQPIKPVAFVLLHS